MERFLNDISDVSRMKTELPFGSKSRLHVNEGIIDYIKRRNLNNMYSEEFRLTRDESGLWLCYRQQRLDRVPLNNTSPGKNRPFLSLDNIVYLAPGIEDGEKFVFSFSDADTILLFPFTDVAIHLLNSQNENVFQYFRKGLIDDKRRIVLNELEIKAAVSGGKTIARYDPETPYITLKKS